MSKSKKKTKKKGCPYVEYSSNNSGGSWWLKDKHWKDLEKAGWEVEWVKDRKGSLISSSEIKKTGRWLGALATRAIRRGLTLEAAVEEWENITRLSSTDAGCPCCGQPHTFTYYDEYGDYVTSGPHTNYEASW